MARLASFFKWLVLAVWTLLVVPFISSAWTGVLDRGDVAGHPVDFIMGWLASFAQAPGVLTSALIMTGVLIGAWIDWLLRKVDGSRAAERQALGLKFCLMANEIDNRFRYDSVWPSNIQDLSPALMSIFIDAEGFGIWAPVEELYKHQDGAAIMVNYLRIVGTMLKDGHFKQAKKRSLQVKDFVAQSANLAISP